MEYGTRGTKRNKKPTNWVGQAKRRATIIRPKAAGRGIFGRALNSDNCRMKVASDVMSGVTLNYVGGDVKVK